jgi:hypothetical protein
LHTDSNGRTWGSGNLSAHEEKQVRSTSPSALRRSGFNNLTWMRLDWMNNSGITAVPIDLAATRGRPDPHLDSDHSRCVSYRNAIRIPGIVKLLPAVKPVQHRPQPTLGTSDVFYVDRSPGREIAQHHKPEVQSGPHPQLRIRSAAQREPSRMLPLHLEKLEPPDRWSRAGCRPPSPWST